MTYKRKNQGVCSSWTAVTVEDGIITDIQIEGGCDGNLKGISAILVGTKPEDAIEKFMGITCDSKETSCPEQIALCLREAVGKSEA